MAFGFLIGALISKKFHRVYSSGRYSCKHTHDMQFDIVLHYFVVRDTDESEIASSAPSTATFTNYDVKGHRSTNVPLFSSDTAPFSDIDQSESSTSRTRSPLFSGTETSRSYLMVRGYPPHISNPDESTLTSGFSIDRPMFSDSTTETSGESPALFGHMAAGGFNQSFTTKPQGEKIALQEYSQKTRSLESNSSSYVMYRSNF